MQTTVVTMETLISDLSTVASSVWEGVIKVSQTIAGDPLLLFTTGFLFVGGCVGIFGRLLSRN